jgi:hypothetical protein
VYCKDVNSGITTLPANLLSFIGDFLLVNFFKFPFSNGHLVTFRKSRGLVFVNKVTKDAKSPLFIELKFGVYPKNVLKDFQEIPD